MNYLKKAKDKIFLVILALAIGSVIASDIEPEGTGGGNSSSSSSGSSGGNASNQRINPPGNPGNISGNPPQSAPSQPQVQPQTQTQTQIQPQVQPQQLRLNADNGALFGPTMPFPVMDSNGRVTYNPPMNNPSPDPTTQSTFVSSENTPQFPSLLDRRLRGLPTHFDRHWNGQPRHTSSDHGNQSVIPAIETGEMDQGPLAPAPKSLMERAGWWEYLAILFGDSGDATALRLILHRLTKLAQLQLGPVEAGRVQAATAFLAEHFKPLLASSYTDFVYNPDYPRNSAMWSTDPGFAAIIRRLVDHVDFFGAQQELERIFGPNTSVAVSFGMRQPEWLRLKLILEQIAWDMKHPDDLIGLWSSTWNLSVAQKLSILAYAANPRGSTPLDLNLPRRDLVLARINLISNGEAPKDPNLIKQESPLDQAHYKYALKQATGSLCTNKPSAEKPVTGNSTGNAPSSLEAVGLKKRVGDYCELINLTPNFNQFCQTSRHDSTPISSLLNAADRLFEEKVITYINHLERLFWSFTWTGSCGDAREALATLTNQIKALGPREELIKKGRIVPPGIADSIHTRLEYMQAIQQTCQNNLQLTGSADVAHIFALLNYGHLEEALAEWSRRFSNVAPRLQGYPGGSILVGAEGQLLYQQARDVRITLLIYKFPRAIYSPCLSRGLMTRDPGTDLTLLNLTHSLDTHRHRKGSSSSPESTSIDPLIAEMSARSLYMRALFLAGRYLESARVAREIASVSEGKLVNEFLACTQLCGSATRNPCEAEKTFNKLQQNILKDQTPQSPQTAPQKDKKFSNAQSIYSVGKELSSHLCRLSRNTASDALSLRYGKVLTTQATFSALKRHFDSINLGEVERSKLKAGRAQSVLPWFGSLPPAPVDEILSFVPTRKLNFVSQVGINGVPLLSPAKTPASSTPGSATSGNDKIFVLGKEYAANILTNSNGPGTTQPQTKLVNGYFQLATPKAANPTGGNSDGSAGGSTGGNPDESAGGSTGGNPDESPQENPEAGGEEE